MAFPQTPFQASLQPASFRGVPFLVESDRGAAGRRNQPHEYPFRDTPYTEDLGRKARRLAFSAFVLGDDCAAQRDQLLAAFEQKGQGLLVHPTLGALQMQPDTLEWEMQRDSGRSIELRLAFVEPGQMIYPQSGADTQAATKTSADQADTAAKTDWQAGIDKAAEANILT